MGFFFVFTYFSIIPYSSPLYFVLFLIISILLIAIFFIDFQQGIIPNSLVVLFTIVVLLLLVLYHQSSILYYFLSGVGAFLFFLLIFLITKGKGMGFGDVKLVFPIGLFLGYPLIFVGLYSAFLTGAVVSIILILAGKKKFRGDSIPFGPFLVLGLFLAYFWGGKVVELFRGLLY